MALRTSKGTLAQWAAMFPFHRWIRPGGPRLSPSAFLPVGPPGRFTRVPRPLPPPHFLGPVCAYLVGAAPPPGRCRRSRCSSSVGPTSTRSRPGSAPPDRRQGAVSAGAAGSCPPTALALPPPGPAGRGQRQWCPAAATARATHAGCQRSLEL